MKTTDLIISANESLLRNKARTLLTIIAIFIGATTLCLTSGIGSGIKSYLNKQVGNLGNSSSLTITAAKSSNTRSSNQGLVKYTPGEKKVSLFGGGSGGETQIALTNSDITKISKVPNIVSVGPTLSVIPDYISAANSPNNKYQFSLNQTIGTSKLDMSSGARVDNNSSQYQITIPSSYISSLGFSGANSAINQKVIIGITDANGTQSETQATIVGIQQKTLIGSTAAYANNSLFSYLYNTQTVGLPASTKDAYASVSAIFKDSLSLAQINSLKSKLKAQGYDAQTIKDQVSTVFTVINAVTYVLDGFAIITLIAATFGIINTLYMSVQDRTKEIGLMKALGMGKQKIFLLFSIEAVLIGFWGSILGIGFANLVGRLVNNVTSKGFLKDFTGLHLLSFPAMSSFIIVIAIMFIAFLAGTLPARRAANKDPIESLRYE
jgi:putative ABC transport system permease protein